MTRYYESEIIASCECTKRSGDNYGFTSPAPGLWVHAQCMRPTGAVVNSMDIVPDSWWDVLETEIIKTPIPVDLTGFDIFD